MKENIFIAECLMSGHSLTPQISDAPTARLSLPNRKVMRRYIMRKGCIAWNTLTCWKNYRAKSSYLSYVTSTQTFWSIKLFWWHRSDSVAIPSLMDCTAHLYHKHVNDEHLFVVGKQQVDAPHTYLYIIYSYCQTSRHKLKLSNNNLRIQML